MNSGICLHGVDCTVRAIFEKHLIRMIRCPCMGFPNAAFFLSCYGFLWKCGDRPHRREDIAVLEKNDNSSLISSAKSSTELDGNAGLPQAYLFQCRQWLIEERWYERLVLLQFLLSHSKASYRVWQHLFAAGNFIPAFLGSRKICKCMPDSQVILHWTVQDGERKKLHISPWSIPLRTAFHSAPVK